MGSACHVGEGLVRLGFHWVGEPGSQERILGCPDVPRVGAVEERTLPMQVDPGSPEVTSGNTELPLRRGYPRIVTGDEFEVPFRQVQEILGLVKVTAQAPEAEAGRDRDEETHLATGPYHPIQR